MAQDLGSSIGALLIWWIGWAWGALFTKAGFAWASSTMAAITPIYSSRSSLEYISPASGVKGSGTTQGSCDIQ